MLLPRSLQGSSKEDCRSRALWLHSVLISSLAPASTGALVLRAGEGEKPSAVVTALPPGVEFPMREFVVRGGWAYILRLTGWERRMRFPGLGETLSSHRARLTRRFDGKVWYIMAAAANPSSGAVGVEGLKAALVPVLEAADAAGQACYTETTSKTTRGVFEACGFVEVEESRYPVFGVNVAVLVRAPHVGGKPVFEVSVDTLRPASS